MRSVQLVDASSRLVRVAIMKRGIVLSTLCLLYCEAAVVERMDDPAVNERPIIGVLSQEQSPYATYLAENYTSYIAASYVKGVESSGAQVVPIMIGRDRCYYKELLGKLNGVLLPGGYSAFNKPNGYADAGQYIYEIAQELNDAGDYFPIFGTCLGFELLIILASGRGEPENKINCYAYTNLPLVFIDDFRTSKMFKDVPEEIFDLFSNDNITVNAHQFCITEENLESHNLTEDWRATSHSDDEYGVRFIATIEHNRYPFYGTQFHPEKPYFEWKASKKYAHSLNAVKANRYFMDFFVKEARKNTHSFKNQAEENEYLIYNFKPYFTGALGSEYNQCYFFEPKGSTE